MSNVQIPNLPAVIALTGTEQLEAVQAGTSVRITTAQIGTYVQSQYPAPGGTSIATSAPITGGTITSTGTIGLAAAGVTNTYLASMAARTVKANITGSTAAPTDATVTSVLDTIGSATGSLLYRNATVWTTLAIGSSNYVLTSNGSAPSWVDPATLVNLTIGTTPIAGGTSGYILYNNGSVLGNKATTGVLDTIGSATGSLLYRNATVWTTLAIGSSNYVLTSNGSAPSWVDPATLVNLTIGTTPIAGGTSGYILYNNGSVLGNKATTGSGNVVLATSPTLVSPALGTPSSVDLTNATNLPLSTGVVGTLPIANGGTAAATAQGAAQNLSLVMQGPSLAWLKALAIPSATLTAINQYRATAGDQGGGTWVFRTGNQSTNVTADPQAGLWAAPDADPTGASGAWQRIYAGDWSAPWFGLVNDGTSGGGTDNKTAFEGLFSAIKGIGSGNYGAARVQFLTGVYKTSAVTSDARGITFIGKGVEGTRISAYSSAQAYIINFTSASTVFVGQNFEVIGWLTTASTSSYPDVGLLFSGGGTNTLNTVNVRNCKLCVWMQYGNDCVVTGCKFSEYLDGDGISTGGGLLLGGVDNGGTAAISENRIFQCKFGSGNANQGAGIILGTDCGATQVLLCDGTGGNKTFIRNVDNLNLGNERACGFLTVANCTGGVVTECGLDLINNSANVKINDSVFSGSESSTGDGIRVASAIACLEIRGSIFQNCRRSGIYSTAAWSITALACTFRRIGIGGGTNGTAVLAASGSQKYYLIGNVFDADLQVNNSTAMDYAFYAAAGWSGQAYIVGNKATDIVIANYQNDSSSGGTMTVQSDNVIAVDSATSAFRITQTGLGDSLLVEDSTSPDASPFVIDNAGRVINADTTSRTFQGGAIPRVQGNATGADNTAWGISNWATSGSTAAQILMAKARGNTVGGHTVVVSGDVLGTWGWAGSDGTAFIPGASIRAEVDGTPGTNDMPTKIILATTADGAAAVTDRWQIGSDGTLKALPGSSLSLLGYSQTYTAPAITANVLTIDLSLGSMFNVSNNANITTFTINNAVASRSNSFTLFVTGNGTGYTQAWGASVKWPGATAPTLTTTNGKVDILDFTTNDGGTTWFATVRGQVF